MTTVTETGAETETDPQVRCSFCAKHESEITKIIAGPGIYICNECVQACNGILDEATTPHVRSPEAELPYWQSLSDEQALAALPKIARVATQVETNLASWVRRLRRRGVSWARIGAAMNMTRQSAWERFSGEE